MQAYKWLQANAVDPETGARMSSESWTPMRGGLFSKKTKTTALAPDLVATGRRIDAELWEVELEGEVEEFDRWGISAEQMRLVRRVETWGDETAGGFAKECILRARDLVAEDLKLLAETPQAADRGVAVSLRAAAEQVAAAGTRRDIEEAAEVAAAVDLEPTEIGETSPIAHALGGTGGQDLWLAARSVMEDPPPEAAAKAATLRINRAGALALSREATAGGGDLNVAVAALQEASRQECRSASSSLLGTLGLTPPPDLE